MICDTRVNRRGGVMGSVGLIPVCETSLYYWHFLPLRLKEAELKSQREDWLIGIAIMCPSRASLFNCN